MPDVSVSVRPVIVMLPEFKVMVGEYPNALPFLSSLTFVNPVAGSLDVVKINPVKEELPVEVTLNAIRGCAVALATRGEAAMPVPTCV